MSAQPSSQVDLARAFGTVTGVLKENQESLNSADEINHNHGDNMVKNFQIITQAMHQTRDASPGKQLAYASQVLREQSQSSSAKLYAQGLADAAQRFHGKPDITAEDAMSLVQALMGGQAQPTAPAAPAATSPGGGADLLSELLSGSAGGSQQDPSTGAGDPFGGLMGGSQPQSQPGGGDLLGGLLGSLLGGGQPAAQPVNAPQSQSGAGIDLNMLLAAGTAFFQARQQGAAPLQALAQAAMSGSQMMNSAHQSQSGQLVATTLINVLSQMLAKN